MSCAWLLILPPIYPGTIAHLCHAAVCAVFYTVNTIMRIIFKKKKKIVLEINTSAHQNFTLWCNTGSHDLET